MDLFKRGKDKDQETGQGNDVSLAGQVLNGNSAPGLGNTEECDVDPGAEKLMDELGDGLSNQMQDVPIYGGIPAKEFNLKDIQILEGPFDESRESKLDSVKAWGEPNPIMLEGEVDINANGELKGFIPGTWAWAWNLLTNGFAVRRPSWKGYWRWDSERQTIVMYTKEGEQLDIRESKDVYYTMDGIAATDWEQAEDAGIVELNVATMPFSDALRHIKAGKVCTREASKDVYGIFIRPEDQLPLEIAVNVKSVSDPVKTQVLGAFGKLHFGRMISCITSDGRIIGWNPTDDDILSNDWKVLSISYDELVNANTLMGSNAGSGE